MKTLRYTYLVALVLITNVCFGQDIHFSQALMTPLKINPANTGAFKGDQRAFLNYRDQWRSVTLASFVTYAAAFDSRIFAKQINTGRLCAGGYVYSDKAGDVELKNTNLNLSLSYALDLGDGHMIGAGLNGGVAQRSINSANFQWGNQFDASGYNAGISSNEFVNVGNRIHGDFGAGIRWSYGQGNSNLASKDAFSAHAGLAAYHVNRPGLEYSLPVDGTDPERLYSRAVIHGGIDYGLKNSRLSFQPNGFVFINGSSREIFVGTMAKWMVQEESKYTGLKKGAAYSFGAHYRVKDAIVLSTLLEVANFAFGVSYDVNVSKLKAATTGRGGLEISLRYINPNPFKGRSSARFM